MLTQKLKLFTNVLSLSAYICKEIHKKYYYYYYYYGSTDLC
jgi:hypothetical protein